MSSARFEHSHLTDSSNQPDLAPVRPSRTSAGGGDRSPGLLADSGEGGDDVPEPDKQMTIEEARHV